MYKCQGRVRARKITKPRKKVFRARERRRLGSIARRTSRVRKSVPLAADLLMRAMAKPVQ